MAVRVIYNKRSSGDCRIVARSASRVRRLEHVVEDVVENVVENVVEDVVAVDLRSLRIALSSLLLSLSLSPIAVVVAVFVAVVVVIAVVVIVTGRRNVTDFLDRARTREPSSSNIGSGGRSRIARVIAKRELIFRTRRENVTVG